MVRFDDDLRALSGGEVCAEDMGGNALARRQRKLNRLAGVIVPDLGCIDAVPVRAVAGAKRVLDRAAWGALPFG